MNDGAASPYRVAQFNSDVTNGVVSSLQYARDVCKAMVRQQSPDLLLESLVFHVNYVTAKVSSSNWATSVACGIRFGA